MQCPGQDRIVFDSRMCRCYRQVRGGVPGIPVYTSFNVRGEPSLRTAEEAFRCFMGTGIEVLAAGNGVLGKEDRDPNLEIDDKGAFELD